MRRTRDDAAWWWTARPSGERQQGPDLDARRRPNIDPPEGSRDLNLLVRALVEKQSKSNSIENRLLDDLQER